VDTREASGQSPCGSGFLESSVEFEFEYTDNSEPTELVSCTYRVYFCYRCTIMANQELEVLPFKIEPVNPPCPEPTFLLLEQIHNARIRDASRAAIKAAEELCDTPPCGAGFQIRFINIPMCWQIQNFGLSYSNHFPYQTLNACLAGEICTTWLQICYDYSTTPPTPVILNESKSMTGNPDCMSFSEWFLEMPNPFFDWTSPCILFDDCD